jgi:branched-chain amino acid transport system substrate-binding protein
MNRLVRRVSGAAVALALTAGASAADLKVGLSVSLSGPNSSLGIPYAKGMQAAVAYRPEINGRKVQLIVLDDGSDPTNAGRNARKLVEEEKVDVLMGSSGVPATIAISQVGRESKTPMIGLSPISLAPAESDWTVTVAQPPQLMIDAVVQRMKRDGIKTVGYIGFTDAWGDLVYNSLMKATEPAGIKVVTNERYARADQSVTGQVLKIVAAHPDAVMTGGSGTPGALPYLALAERGFKGNVYGQHGLINPDFVRVAGASANGSLMPTGPVIVAEQLPNDYPTKKIALEFRNTFQKVNGAPHHRRLLGLLVRRLHGVRRCRGTGQGRARHAGVPPGAARRDLQQQGGGRHARRLQLQARRPVRRRRACARDRQARRRPVEAGTMNSPTPEAPAAPPARGGRARTWKVQWTFRAWRAAESRDSARPARHTSGPAKPDPRWPLG